MRLEKINLEMVPKESEWVPLISNSAIIYVARDLIDKTKAYD